MINDRCEDCQFHGPDFPTMIADWRELHRALHCMIALLCVPAGMMLTWVYRTLETRK